MAMLTAVNFTEDPKSLGIQDNSSVLLTPDSTPTKSSCSDSSATFSSSSEAEETCTALQAPHTKHLPYSEAEHMRTYLGTFSSDNSPSNSDKEEAVQSKESKNLTRSQSDTVLDSPKPSKSKLVKSEETTQASSIMSSKPPKPGALKAGSAKQGRRKRVTKDTKKTTSSTKTSAKATSSTAGKKSDKKRSSSVPAKSTPEKNTLMTDYFPVRRSSRVPKSKLKEQNQKDLEHAILSNCEDGLEVVKILGKGRGVVATKPFSRGDFVVEYYGTLINVDEAKSLEQRYSATPDVGCYMYYFKFNNKCYCVDATAESGRLGRLLNHSKAEANCATKVVGIDSRPYLILVAHRDIDVGEELLYDYGDRSKESLEAHPWLKL